MLLYYTAQYKSPLHWGYITIIQPSTRVRLHRSLVLQQTSPVFLYYTLYTLYSIQPSTRAHCIEATAQYKSKATLVVAVTTGVTWLQLPEGTRDHPWVTINQLWPVCRFTIRNCHSFDSPLPYNSFCNFSFHTFTFNIEPTGAMHWWSDIQNNGTSSKL